MTEEQKQELKDKGWFGVINHYHRQLHNKKITEEDYHKAINYWKKEFSNGQTSIIEKRSTDPIEALCAEFGSLNDTGEEIYGVSQD